ncbi:N-succinylarginine dihydrolase [Aggregicoccus sp. 17bor-14]|uniref:N-succinylarginine dihydrolase n=1 Tax=Myxococcaceae TaxID=31 RepID=UPI00129CA9C4|nr:MULTISPECIES: N-succinylarginine dihydrolase [Myxococcaceae]MBF5045030.1 N-succinylarginine dihydrolase [Simulacricoccus sp. 17bor-14]MRI90773.1 N-succinylarginine dihydrolase [Aggregicoccus sp. 17bor-14]
MREYNFDGLVGPTHNYGGLSVGNLASARHGGSASNPREAALQGLEKMRAVAALGVGQAVLPPQPRPSLRMLRRLGFSGTDEQVITRAAKEAEHLLRLTSSAAAMWTANAATVAPSCDTADGRMHATPANLHQMFHRMLEADTTHSVFRAIFADEARFAIHEPLPGGGQFADEGAANHTRLATPGHKAVHLFAWGRSAFQDVVGPQRFPARQTLEASQALARLHQVDPAQSLFPQQAPEGIDAGAFHTDVLAVGNDSFLMLHELAFVDAQGLLARLRALLGERFRWAMAGREELPAADAVRAYPFNSQVLTLPDGSMAIVAPLEAKETPAARAFLERVVAEDNPVKAVHYLDVRQSMNNGGGPACLRQRIWLTEEERGAVRANVFYGEALHQELAAWVRRHYRDSLRAADLQDPALAREVLTALDELTRILRLGPVYDFQR